MFFGYLGMVFLDDIFWQVTTGVIFVFPYLFSFFDLSVIFDRSFIFLKSFSFFYLLSFAKPLLVFRDDERETSIAICNSIRFNWA